MKKESGRMDLLSRRVYPKSDLFRLVLVSGSLRLEGERPLLGRGVYLKKDKESLGKAKAKRLLEKRFRLDDCSFVYEEMEGKL